LLFAEKSATIFLMKWIVILVCFGVGLAQGKTMVFEAELPKSMPALVHDIKIPTAKDAGWSLAEAPQKVRQFLAAKNSDAEKIDVLSWWASKAERPDFLYDLAARCAKADQVDAAIYWLQRAAREDVCDVADLSADERFASVKKDVRWSKLLGFLRACEAAWLETSFYRDVLTLPESYDGKSSIPLVIGLHGYGSLPEDFAGADFQKISDTQNIAFLAVSGRRPLGRHAFMWTESFEKDRQHVENAILRSRKHFLVAPGRLVAAGFSQGGQLAAELVAFDPQQYRGCISMSPGSRYASGLVERLQSRSSLTGQRYFFTWISGEGSGPRTRVLSWRQALEQKQALVHEYEFPGSGHEWPRNYEDYFAITLQVLLR
jgi:predicted esterase